jgi:hypothetical protein
MKVPYLCIAFFAFWAAQQYMLHIHRGQVAVVVVVVVVVTASSLLSHFCTGYMTWNGRMMCE